PIEVTDGCKVAVDHTPHPEPRIRGGEKRCQREIREIRRASGQEALDTPPGTLPGTLRPCRSRPDRVVTRAGRRTGRANRGAGARRPTGRYVNLRRLSLLQTQGSLTASCMARQWRTR